MTPRGCSLICVIQILSASTAFAQIINAPTPHSGKINPYTVDGFALGARIDFETPTYRGYQCSPSEQFPDFTRCQRTQKQETIWRRSFESTSSVMHSRDGIAVYINRHIPARVFDRSEVQNDINKLSSRFGERAREMRMPQREGLPNAVIASWGKIRLEPLDPDAISMLASGQSPRKGLLVDYLGDLRRSAQLALPIYSLSGGAGYLWSASVDRNGRGHLRFLTVDASALNRPIATQPQQSETAETEKIALEKVTVDPQFSPVEPEKAKNEIATPTASDRLTAAERAKNLTVDASALNRPSATQPQQSETAETEKTSLEKVTVDTQFAPVEPEKAKNEIARPTASDRLNPAAERANTGADELEQLGVDNRANSHAFVARLEADLARAKARSQAMETLAYRAVVGLVSLVVILGALLLVRRRKARAKSQKVHTSEIHLINPAQPESIQAQPQRLGLEQKSVAAKHTSPATILVENELNKESLQSAATNLRPCIHCNRGISIHDKYCMYCGAAVASTRLCSSCRNEIGAAARFCRHCGASSIAVVASSMTFSSEGDNEVITNGVQAPARKRKGRKRANGHQTASSQADGLNPKGE
jgi:Double zinc ribbon